MKGPAFKTPETLSLDASSGKRLNRWQWPGMSTTALAFAPDGRHLAVGNRNGTVYVLRLSEKR